MASHTQSGYGIGQTGKRTLLVAIIVILHCPAHKAQCPRQLFAMASHIPTGSELSLFPDADIRPLQSGNLLGQLGSAIFFFLFIHRGGLNRPTNTAILGIGGAILCQHLSRNT